LTTQALSPFAPRWTWRSVVLAASVTLAIYVLLPYLERLSATPPDPLQVRSVDTTPAPQPPPPPEPVYRDRTDTAVQTPRPELQHVRRRLTPLQASMNLRMALGDIEGDFNVDFGVSSATLSEQVELFIFEIGDLDEPPRPLARLKPIYPPHARMRGIEGVVSVEFVVGADGAVRDVTVAQAEPPGVFDRAAVRAIEGWRFVPGKKKGQSVAARVRQKVAFRLD
jgi:protein TonB